MAYTVNYTGQQNFQNGQPPVGQVYYNTSAVASPADKAMTNQAQGAQTQSAYDSQGRRMYTNGSGGYSTDPNSFVGGGTPVPDNQTLNPNQQSQTSPKQAPPVPAPYMSPVANLGNTPYSQGYTPPQVMDNSSNSAPVVPNTETPGANQSAQKWQQIHQNVQDNGGKAPDSAGAARVAISENTPPQPSQGYTPTPAFMAVGDPIMQQYMMAAKQAQTDVTESGYASSNLQATFSNQLHNIDLQAASMQNIMNGTREDIQAEVSKAGGMMNESQLDAMVVSRNRDLLKQYNNLELQKQTMQSQMQMQVQLSQADHQYAQDNYQNVMGQTTLYRNIYDNAQTQVDKQVQNLGYKGIAQTYAGNPGVLNMYERFLGMPQGTLSNPKAVDAMETYRERSLAIQNSRFGATYGYPVDGAPGASGGTSGGASVPGGGAHPQQNPNVPYAQYGLLSHTDFDPTNKTDQTANSYLDTYLKSGEMPTLASLGLKGAGVGPSNLFQSAKTRAENLYFAATGQNLPSPEIIKSNLKIIGSNNQLANNLKVQEQTVDKNFGLSLQNLNANNLNQGYSFVNNALNSLNTAMQDPNVAQYLTQNATIQQELGNLLAVKNAAGTTVHDKIAGAGLMPDGASPEVQVRIVKTLLQEAKNASNAITEANGDIYKQIDPLERQTDNPNRQLRLNAPAPTDVLMSGPDGKQFYVPSDKVEVMKKHGYKQQQ